MKLNFGEGHPNTSKNTSYDPSLASTNKHHICSHWNAWESQRYHYWELKFSTEPHVQAAELKMPLVCMHLVYHVKWLICLWVGVFFFGPSAESESVKWFDLPCWCGLLWISTLLINENKWKGFIHCHYSFNGTEEDKAVPEYGQVQEK